MNMLRLSENHIESNHFDAIVLFFVLHDIYLNNEMSEELLATLKNVLKPDQLAPRQRGGT